MARSRIRRSYRRRRPIRRPIRRRKSFRRRIVRRRPIYRRRRTNARRAAVRRVSKWYKVISDRIAVPQAGYNIIGQQVLSLASSVHASAEASNWVYYRVDAALLKYKWRGQIADAKKVGSNGIAIIDPNTGAVSYSESAYGNDGIKIVYLKDTDGTKGETTAGAMLKDPRTRVSIVRPNGRAVSVYGKFAHVVPIYTGPATAYGWKPSRSFVSTDYPACSFYGITVGIYNDSQQSITNAQLDRELWMKVTFKTEKAAYPRKQQVMFPIGSQYVHDFTIAGPATEPAVDEGATAIPTNPTPGEINIVQQAQ